MAKTYLVTRHAATAQWIAMQGVKIDEQIVQFSADLANKGDTVIGNLPINLVADLNKKGVTYQHLEMNVPKEFRGKELTVEQMQNFGAKLVGYQAQRV